ncbi:MAG: hypothetical protein WB493_08595 [Anaeromyxobacteraceae bacterium]
MHPRNLAVAAFVGLSATAAHAQGNVAQSAAQTVQVVQSRAANAALMKQYTWNERIDFLVNGQQKDLRIDLVNFGPDGKLQRTTLNDQSAPLPGGFFRKKIAEDEKKDVEKYLKGLGELLHQYTLPTPGAVMNFLDSAVPVPSGPGQVMVTGLNVVQPGDSLTVYLDAATRKTQRLVVNTAFQGNPVNLTATFATLPNGLNYPAYVELLVPAKGYDVQVQNFNFQQNGM